MSLIDELVELEDVTERQMMKFGDTRFVSEGSHSFLELNDGRFLLTDSSLKSLSETLDVPVPYAKRMSPELKDLTFNYLLKDRGDAETAVLLNTEKETVRSFMNPQYPYVASRRVFDVVEKSMNDLEVPNYHLDDTALEIVSFSEQFATNVNDSPVRAGVRILYSDSWAVFPRFDAYLCRIACFNSAITPIVSKKFRISKKSDSDVLIQAQEFIEEAMSQIQPMIDGFEDLQKIKVEKWASLVKRVCEENRLPKKIYDLIIEMASDPQFLATVTNQRIETMYDLVNLLTYFATHHPEITDAHREHIFSISGNIMLYQDTRCNSCGGRTE